MIVRKRALPRRTLLRGAGAVLALPLLDAMLPALTAAAKTPADPAKLRRLGFVYMPMGCDETRWTPPGASEPGVTTLDELSSTLSSLAPIKDKIAVIANLELRNAYPGTHATSNASFLSAAKAKRTESTDYHLGTTVDQIAAQQIGKNTVLPSLELSMDLLSVVGQCDNGYACVYQNNLSWSSPTTPLPAEAHPRIVFENLFGDATAAALKTRASLLDSVSSELKRLQKTLGPTDKSRVDEYLASVRDVEQRIERAEASAKENPLPDKERPTGVPASYADHARLMFDLQILAMQADITRVITFQLARETSNRSYTEIGIAEPHHPLTHHGNDPAKIAKVAKINQFHVSLFSEFLQKLAATKEAGGTLLDHSLYLYGSGMGNPNIHDHINLPIIVAGGAAGNMRGGEHIRFKDPTPLANLHLTLLDKVGVKLDAFADSNGKLDDLFQPLSM